MTLALLTGCYLRAFDVNWQALLPLFLPFIYKAAINLRCVFHFANATTMAGHELDEESGAFLASAVHVFQMETRVNH